MFELRAINEKTTRKLSTHDIIDGIQFRKLCLKEFEKNSSTTSIICYDDNKNIKYRINKSNPDFIFKK